MNTDNGQADKNRFARLFGQEIQQTILKMPLERNPVIQSEY